MIRFHCVQFILPFCCIPAGFVFEYQPLFQPADLQIIELGNYFDEAEHYIPDRNPNLKLEMINFIIC